MHLVQRSTLGIFGQGGNIIGTGFLVKNDLVLTCSHVWFRATTDGDGKIQVRFTGQTESTTASLYADKSEVDVVVLKVDTVPTDAHPLSMDKAIATSPDNPFYSFGYATAASTKGIATRGTVVDYLSESKMVQIRSHEAHHGMSGAPVYDEICGAVIGMINKGETRLGHNSETTFAIPSETIWEVCPELKTRETALHLYSPILEGIHYPLTSQYLTQIQNFLIEYLGTKEAPKPFGGREKTLEKLDQWLEHGKTPFMLLAAPAGRGKSALLVRWIELLRARADLDIVFVPISIRFKTHLATALFSSLGARLAYIHGESVPSSKENSLDFWKRLCAKYLRISVPGNRNLIIILDGLDEAGDWQPGPDLFPAILPERTRVVVSARYLAKDKNASDWLTRLGWDRKGMASILELDPITRAGIDDVIKKMELHMELLAHPSDIISELYRLSEGDPLLVNLYVSDLWARGDDIARLTPDVLNEIEPGYDGYFNRWWDDQKILWGAQQFPLRQSNVQTVLNLLTAAQGHLAKNDILDLSDGTISSFDLDDALDILKRFIIGNGLEHGYTFGHPKLGNYFWDKLGDREKKQLDAKFLNWGKRTIEALFHNEIMPDEVPFYLVEYYGTHLERNHETLDEKLKLIEYPWAQAWFAYEKAYGGYLHDVENIWSECKESDRILITNTGKTSWAGKQIRCGLIKASLHSLAGNIQPGLLLKLVENQVWTPGQALIHIRQMPDEAQRAEALLGLLPKLDEKRLQDALLMANLIQEEEKCSALLCALAPFFPIEVVYRANEFTDIMLRIDVLKVAAAYVPNLWDELLSSVSRIQYSNDKANVLLDYADIFPESLLEKVIAVAKGKDLSEGSKALVLRKMATRKPELWKEVVISTRKIINEFDLADAIEALVDQLPEEYFEEVLALAATIKNEEAKAQALEKIGSLLPTRLIDKFLSIADKIENKYKMMEILIALSILHPRTWLKTLQIFTKDNYFSENIEQLNKIIEQSPDELIGQIEPLISKLPNKIDQFCAISYLVLRRNSYWPKTLKFIKTLENSESYGSIADRLAQNMPDDLRFRALSIVETIKNPYFRIRAMARYARGDISTWKKIVSMIDDLGKYELDYLFSEIMQYYYPDEFNSDVALSFAAKIQNRYREDDAKKARMLCVLVPHLPEIENEILVIASRTDNEYEKNWILDELSSNKNRFIFSEQAMPHGIAPEFISWDHQIAEAQKIQDESAQAKALAGLIMQLPDKFLYETLPTLKALDNPDKARALKILTQRLPEFITEYQKEVRNLVTESGQNRMIWDQVMSMRNLADEIPELWPFILATTRQIHSDIVLSIVLINLIPDVPESLLFEIQQIAEQIRYTGYRTDVMISLASRLPGLWDKVLAALPDIGEPDRAEKFGKIVDTCPQDHLEMLASLGQQFKDLECRAIALLHLSKKLDNVIDDVLSLVDQLSSQRVRLLIFTNLIKQRPELHEKYCQALMKIDKLAFQVEILERLVEFIPNGWIEQLSKNANQLPLPLQYKIIGMLIERRKKVADAASLAGTQTSTESLDSLPPELLIPTDPNLRYELFRNVLVNTASTRRETMLLKMQALVELITPIQSPETIDDVYFAIRDVTQWWP